MKHLIQLLIISIAVIGIATPSFAGDDREDRGWDRDKKEQSHNSKKDKHHGNPFDKILEQLDDLNDKLDELLANGVDLRGVTQNWDKKLDSTNGDANGCNSDRFTCLWDDTAVRDNETGLVWERSPDFGVLGSWSRSIRHCASQEVGGRKGWSMPTLEQLLSLMDTANSPAFPAGHPFLISGGRTQFWTATTAVDAAADAWGVSFGFANEFTISKEDFSIDVWCVRGGQTYDGQDLNSLN